jgi:hypothetical protein
MFETKHKVATVDPVWRRVCEEAVEAIRNELAFCTTALWSGRLPTASR